MMMRVAGVCALSLGWFIALGGPASAGPDKLKHERVANQQPGSAKLPEPANERLQLATALLDRLHVPHALQGWKAMLTAAAPDCGCNGPAKAELATAWTTAVGRAYDSARLYDALRGAMAGSFSPADLRKSLAFRDTPLGRKITALEKPVAVDQKDAASAQLAILQGAQALDADPVRKKVVEEIVAASGGAKTLVATLLNVSIGASTGANAATPAGQPRMSDEQILEAIEARRAPMVQVMKFAIVGMYAVKFKSLSLNELQRYRNEAVSPLEIELRDVFMEAFNRELRAQSIDIGTHFAKEMSGRSL